MTQQTTLSGEAHRIVALMRETRAPLVVSAKIVARPRSWRDHKGQLRHMGYPYLSDHPGRFICTVAGQRVPARGVQSLMKRWLLECYRPGWLVRARFRLREEAHV